MKKIKGLRRIFDGSRLFRLILEFMDVGMRNTVSGLPDERGKSVLCQEGHKRKQAARAGISIC